MQKFTWTLILFLIAGCSNSYYRFQGLNTTECAPAVGCMVINLVGKQCKNTAEARSFNTKTTYWSFGDLKNYLDSRGIESRYKADDITILMIQYFFTPHYVVVKNDLVYDPLWGIYGVDKLTNVYKTKLGVKS